MLGELLDRDEVPCIEDAEIGYSSLTIFLKALKQYCPEIVDYRVKHMTYEGRGLYEVHLTHLQKDEFFLRSDRRQEEPVPIFIIDAGQEGGRESVMLALYLIEQLVACEENDWMLYRVRWVILPSTNPDGQEYSQISTIPWRKNSRPAIGDASFGVDITRNFESNWGACPVQWGFSQTYPGPMASSEMETVFITNVLRKHRKYAKMYLSIRRNGHSLNYPYAFSNIKPNNESILTKVAGEVALKVNQRTGGVQLFSNNTIFEAEGQAHCGHSVDYAYNLGITLSFEMRVFLESDNRILSMFQTLPRGYETSLRNGYFTGIKELYNVLTNKKKYNFDNMTSTTTKHHL